MPATRHNAFYTDRTADRAACHLATVTPRSSTYDATPIVKGPPAAIAHFVKSNNPHKISVRLYPKPSKSRNPSSTFPVTSAAKSTATPRPRKSRASLS